MRNSPPPGHHALANKAMGFCVFNHAAIAARYAQKTYGIDKIAIVDFDVHHANGTQKIFEKDSGVFHASIHQLPLWPETGYAHETGCGNLLNVPIAPNTSRDEWLCAWREKILSRVDSEKPKLIIVSAGFDAHKGEPKSRQNLETKDFYTITRDLVALANKHSGGRVISILEGGYNIQLAAESCMEHLRGLGEKY